MFSKHKARLVVLATAAATLAGGLFVYVTPASTNVNPAPAFDRPGITDGLTLRPWGEDLSEQAVDSGGIEKDLDGNTASLFALDQLALAAGMR